MRCVKFSPTIIVLAWQVYNTMTIKKLTKEFEILSQRSDLLPGYWIDNTHEKQYHRLIASGGKYVRMVQPDELDDVRDRIEKGNRLIRIQKVLTEIEDLVGSVLTDGSIHHSSESNEWYTPPEWIELAREVMDGIDVDPASCEAAQKNVKAKVFYTQEDDGFNKDWTGKLWLNPPYGAKSKTKGVHGAGTWIDKAIAEFDSGNVIEGFLLLRLTGSAAIRKLESRFPRCSVGRVPFIDENGNLQKRVGHDSIFFYLTSQEWQVDRFKRVFEQVLPNGKTGKVLTP